MQKNSNVVMDQYCGFANIRRPHLWKAALGELIGTMMLTTIGCGTCLGKDNWERAPTPNTVQISLAFGLAVSTMVWCFGHVSGGHINPAVTVAFLVTRRLTLTASIVYVSSQMIGACMGAGILAGLSSYETWGNLGLTTLDLQALSRSEGFSVEMMITAVLVFTIFSSCDKKRTDLNGSAAPLTIGFVVTACHLFAIKYTGSSMNPARTFGPAFILGLWPEACQTITAVNSTTGDYTVTESCWDNHAIYWFAPMLGGIFAGFLYEFVFAVNASMGRCRAMLTQFPYSWDDDIGEHQCDGDITLV